MTPIKKSEESAPNKFTVQMGELIKKAREDAGLSQGELAEKIYRRRETVSLMENGKTEVGTMALAGIAAATKKQISYFIPGFAKHNITEETLDDDEYEILSHFRRIINPKYREITLNQIQTLAEMDEKEFSEEYWKEVLEGMDKDDPTYKRLRKKGFFK